MRPDRVFEACLYAADLDAARRFYVEVLGLDLAMASPRLAAFRCGQGVLLVFDPHQSLQETPGRGSPPHGAQGAGHVAFAIQPSEIEGWRRRLQSLGVAVEAELDWPSGGHSIYFRDPAGNSIELVTPLLWGFGPDGAWKPEPV